VQHEHTYRLVITGRDGRASSVDVEIPPRTTLFLGAADTSQGVRLPAVLRGDAPLLLKTEVSVLAAYVTGYSDPLGRCPVLNFVIQSVPYDGRIVQNGQEWAFEVDLVEFYGRVLGRIIDRPDYRHPQEGILLGYVQFRAVVGTEVWRPPGGVFDPRVLIQPGSFDNVENGFGLVVGGYSHADVWTLLPEVVSKTGFRHEPFGCETTWPGPSR
jgi:hypothetical protein